MNDLLSFAQIYKSLGWSVIPIRVKSKMPAVAWKPYQKKIATDEELKNWFGGKQAKDIGIGLVTGKLSNVVVVDLDLYKDGSLFLKLETPVIVKTGGGGLHGYFKYREGIRNTVEIKEGADIRGEGGYVVLPPSIHPSGATYKWESQDFKNMPEFPVDDFERIEKEGERLDIADMVNVDHGSRNDNLYRTACSLLNHINPKEAFHVIEQINRTYDPPVLQRELVTLFESAYDFVSQDLEEQKQKEEEEIPEVFSFKEFSKIEFPQKTWLVKNFVRATGIVLFVGEGGVGKTSLSYNFTKAITTGTDWFNFPTNRSKVLILDKENDPIDIKTNLLAQGILPSEDIFVLADTKLTLLDKNFKPTKQAKHLSDLVKQENIETIILDSFVDFLVGNENDSVEIAKNFNAWQSLFPGVALVIIHHQNKPVQGMEKNPIHKVRGSSHIFNAAQTVLSFSVEDPINYPQNILINHTKVRGARKQLPFEVEMLIEESPKDPGETIITGFKYLKEVKQELLAVDIAKRYILSFLSQYPDQWFTTPEIKTELSDKTTENNIDAALPELRDKAAVISDISSKPFKYHHRGESDENIL